MGPSVRMPFGRYRGLRVDDLEPEYCGWLLRRWTGPMAQSLRAALEEVRDRKIMETAK